MTKLSTCCKASLKRYFEGYIRADNKRGGKVIGMQYKCGACGMTQKKSIVKVMCEFHGKQTSAKEIERQLGVTYKTAWRMAKQIRKVIPLQYSVNGANI